MVRKYTSKHAIVDKEHGTSCSHLFRPTNAAELVNFDGIVSQNGNENINNSWCDDDLDDFIL